MSKYIILHIGLNRPSQPPVSKEVVIEDLANLFESFTVVEAIGIYRGERESTLVVGIAAPQNRVFDAAKHLRDKYGWEGIGVVTGTGAVYTRVTDAS